MNKTQYLLVKLMEECSEIQQLASKACVFGAENRKPNPNEIELMNIEKMRVEVSDLYGILEMLKDEGLDLTMNAKQYRESVEKKKLKVKKFMKISQDLGYLDEGVII